MTGKNKNFPLPLSSVKKENERGHFSFTNQLAMPQTATKNAFQNAQKQVVGSVSKVVNLDAKKLSVVSEKGNTALDALRHAMVARLKKQGITDKEVLNAMNKVPRHVFVEEAFSSQAYVDLAMPIGHHQTISQPYIVAKMLEILRNGKPLGRVLEVGTGCGYQACVLSEVAKEVFSIERIKALHELAKNNLRSMRIANIRLQYGDGMLGLPQAAPFDGIILAAAGADIPAPLLEQLAVGGRLIAPVGEEQQGLYLIERVSDNKWSRTALEKCNFVPLRAGLA
jgi:protein-L-isoaspartate(D-aspartate) O-methyltransferase